MKKRTTLSVSEAFEFCIEEIMNRKRRSFLTLMSIILATAFLSYTFMTTDIFIQYNLKRGTALQLENYQYWLISLSFIVCAVSITNSMLISVYERYRDIGTMKCLGALNSHILTLFLIESTIFGVVGGSIGYVLGCIAALIMNGVQLGSEASLSISISNLILTFFLAVVVSTLLSVVSSIYPAKKAADAPPEEALRYEL